MFQGLYSLVISALFGVPLIGSLYVLVTPSYKLIESWQNWKISRSHRPLKDEHFKSLPRTILICKWVSLLVLLVALFGLVTTIMSMAGPKQPQ
jgi:hypothetical protein